MSWIPIMGKEDTAKEGPKPYSLKGGPVLMGTVVWPRNRELSVGRSVQRFHNMAACLSQKRTASQWCLWGIPKPRSRQESQRNPEEKN